MDMDAKLRLSDLRTTSEGSFCSTTQPIKKEDKEEGNNVLIDDATKPESIEQHPNPFVGTTVADSIVVETSISECNEQVANNDGNNYAEMETVDDNDIFSVQLQEQLLLQKNGNMREEDTAGPTNVVNPIDLESPQHQDGDVGLTLNEQTSTAVDTVDSQILDVACIEEASMNEPNMNEIKTEAGKEVPKKSDLVGSTNIVRALELEPPQHQTLDEQTSTVADAIESKTPDVACTEEAMVNEPMIAEIETETGKEVLIEDDTVGTTNVVNPIDLESPQHQSLDEQTLTIADEIESKTSDVACTEEEVVNEPIIAEIEIEAGKEVLDEGETMGSTIVVKSIEVESAQHQDNEGERTLEEPISTAVDVIESKTSDVAYIEEVAMTEPNVDEIKTETGKDILDEGETMGSTIVVKSIELESPQHQDNEGELTLEEPISTAVDVIESKTSDVAYIEEIAMNEPNVDEIKTETGKDILDECEMVGSTNVVSPIELESPQHQDDEGGLTLEVQMSTVEDTIESKTPDVACTEEAKIKTEAGKEALDGCDTVVSTNLVNSIELESPQHQTLDEQTSTVIDAIASITSVVACTEGAAVYEPNIAEIEIEAGKEVLDEGETVRSTNVVIPIELKSPQHQDDLGGFTLEEQTSTVADAIESKTPDVACTEEAKIKTDAGKEVPDEADTVGLTNAVKPIDLESSQHLNDEGGLPLDEQTSTVADAIESKTQDVACKEEAEFKTVTGKEFLEEGDMMGSNVMNIIELEIPQRQEEDVGDNETVVVTDPSYIVQSEQQLLPQGNGDMEDDDKKEEKCTYTTIIIIEAVSQQANEGLVNITDDIVTETSDGTRAEETNQNNNKYDIETVADADECKTDPPLDIHIDLQNVRTGISIEIVDQYMTNEFFTTTDTMSPSTGKAPDPPEFSNFVFDADSSIARIRHDDDDDDNENARNPATETKESDPPEFSNVVFDADASIVRLHFGLGEKEETVGKRSDTNELDPPECAVLVFEDDSSSCVKLNKDSVEQVETNTSIVTSNGRDTIETRNIGSDPPECSNLFSDGNSPASKGPNIDAGEMIDDGSHCKSEMTVDLPESTDALTDSAIGNLDSAHPEIIESTPTTDDERGTDLKSELKATLNPTDDLAMSSDGSLVSKAVANDDVVTEKETISTVENSSESSKIPDESVDTSAEKCLPPDCKLSELGSTNDDTRSRDQFTVQNNEMTSMEPSAGATSGAVVPHTSSQNADEENSISQMHELVPIEVPAFDKIVQLPANERTDDEGIVETPSTQELQLSFADITVDEDDFYDEIIVDGDDEFIEYVDEILDDDFTEETIDSHMGDDTTFIINTNGFFNCNVSRATNMDDFGHKRPVIKSATQKALEKEVAVKTAEAEEVLENVRFRMARQNSFCRKDDEYRKQLEIEEEEHLRHEEEEERKRVAEQDRQSRLNAEKVKAHIAQQEEADLRQRLYDEEIERQSKEAEALRFVAEQAAREKETADNLRRLAEEREKTERDTKRKAMEDEVQLLQARLAEAKVATDEAKKKQKEEKKRLKAKVDAHRKEKKRTSVMETTPTNAEVVSTITNDIISVESESKTEVTTLDDTTPTPPPSAATPTSNTVYYPIDVLREQSVPGLDYKNREIYIHPDEYPTLFMMSIEEFNEQPKWKRTNLKRKQKLF